jgi:hypothetical protein
VGFDQPGGEIDASNRLACGTGSALAGQGCDPGHQNSVFNPKRSKVDPRLARETLAEPFERRILLLGGNLQAGETNAVAPVAVTHLQKGGRAHLKDLGRLGWERTQ